MKNVLKKLLPGLMAAVMLLSIIPTAALAAESGSEYSQGVQDFLDLASSIPEVITEDSMPDVYELVLTCRDAYEKLSLEEQKLNTVQEAYLLLEQAIDRISAFSETMVIAENSIDSDVVYKDGTYTGTGTGYGGTVTLSVTISNGQIANIEAVNHSETSNYWNRAIS